MKTLGKTIYYNPSNNDPPNLPILHLTPLLKSNEVENIVTLEVECILNKGNKKDWATGTPSAIILTAQFSN